MKKKAVEMLLVKSTLNGLPAKRLLKSSHLGCVELVWPRTGVAKKSVAREIVFKKGVADFSLVDSAALASAHWSRGRGAYLAGAGVGVLGENSLDAPQQTKM